LTEPTAAARAWQQSRSRLWATIIEHCGPAVG
jgi:hypothetical protein